MGIITRAWIGTLALGLVPALAPPASADERKQDERKQLAFEVVDRNAQQMADISDSIFYFGELGMQEFEGTKLLKDTLTAAGFKVELGGAGMPTSFWAEYGSGAPKIAIVTEIDALPGGSQTPGSYERKPLVKDGPGHMEGHNTHGGVASLAAFAVKEVMQRHSIPGTVAISFGPAEEQLASRPYLVRAGIFKDVDAIIYLHIGDGLTTGYGVQNYAAISSVFTFHGKTAHGAVNPWDGKDAVDAVELMDIGFDKLREHLRPTYRAHRTITAGGIQPNIIADKGQIWWFVRDASMPAARETYDKLLKIAEGAALMTGTTWDVQYAASAWPQLRQQDDRRGGTKEYRGGRRAEMERAGAAVRQGLPESGAEAGRRAADATDPARRAGAGHLLERQRRCVLGGAGRPLEFSRLGSRDRVSRMEGGGDAGELDLAPGPSGGSEGAGGVDHRSLDVAGASAASARRIRARVRRKRRIFRWCRQTPNRTSTSIGPRWKNTAPR